VVIPLIVKTAHPGGGPCHELLLLGPLHAVLGTALFAVIHTKSIERTSNNVVPDTGKVPDAAATNEHDGVLLEIVALATDVGGDFLPVGEAYTSHLAKR